MLLDTIDALLAQSTSTHAIDVDSHDGATLSWLYGHGEVIERLDDDQGIHVKVRLDEANWSRFEQRSASNTVK